MPYVAPDVLIHLDHLHSVEPVDIVDQDTLALGQDRVVRGVPRHSESFGDPGDGQVLHNDDFQRPPQPRRDSFARGSAAVVVSWRHTCPQPLHR
jgi:hypothetical protein